MMLSEAIGGLRKADIQLLRKYLDVAEMVAEDEPEPVAQPTS
jgi:hypothetical protein